MKGKIFAMFAVMMATLVVFGAGNVQASTGNVAVNMDVSTSKSVYTPADDIEITVHYIISIIHPEDAIPLMTRPMVYILLDDQETGPDDCIDWSETHTWTTEPIEPVLPSNLPDSTYEVTTYEVIISIVYPNPGAGTHTVEAYVEVGTGSGTYSDSDTTNFIAAGPSSAATEHIPENQGTAHNPNL